MRLLVMAGSLINVAGTTVATKLCVMLTVPLLILDTVYKVYNGEKPYQDVMWSDGIKNRFAIAF